MKMKIYAESNEFLHDNVRTRWIDGTNKKYAVREDSVILSYVNPENIKIMKQSYTDKRYKKILIRYYGKDFTKRVHRLVAEAFIDNPEPELYVEVDHKDEVRDNNHYTNLRWCTGTMNKHYAYKNKHGEDWEPQQKRTREEIEQRKLDIAKRKQEKINNMPYGSVQEMINQTAKPVLVNGTRFQSAKEAARYICEDEDITAKVDTVRKSIKDMIDGKRKPWTYKNKYRIEKTDTSCIPAVADKGILSLNTNRTKG